ncbi:MAG: pilus assembly protein HicB [Bacteroidales bacterium]|nr:pilus assembly protein HicB [Bacteroidales bacterium]
MKKSTALIEMGKDGTFGVFTPDTHSTIIGDGKTIAEAKADFENSVREIIRLCEEDGIEEPDDLKNTIFVYKYDIASFLHYNKYLNMTKFAEYAGINPSLMRQYKRGQYISSQQVSKIQKAINKIGRELAAIKLI